MSLRTIAWAWEQYQLKPRERMTLMALAQHADTAGVCWPKIKTLAHEASLSGRSVELALMELEKDGLIHKEQRFRADGGKTSCLYTLLTPGATVLPPPVNSSGVIKETEPSPGNLVKEPVLSLSAREAKTEEYPDGRTPRWKLWEELPEKLRVACISAHPDHSVDATKETAEFLLSNRHAQKEYGRLDLYLTRNLRNERSQTRGNGATARYGGTGSGGEHRGPPPTLSADGTRVLPASWGGRDLLEGLPK